MGSWQRIPEILRQENFPDGSASHERSHHLRHLRYRLAGSTDPLASFAREKRGVVSVAPVRAHSATGVASHVVGGPRPAGHSHRLGRVTGASAPCPPKKSRGELRRNPSQFFWRSGGGRAAAGSRQEATCFAGNSAMPRFQSRFANVCRLRHRGTEFASLR